jgi:hypothetical protein
MFACQSTQVTVLRNRRTCVAQRGVGGSSALVIQHRSTLELIDQRRYKQRTTMVLSVTTTTTTTTRTMTTTTTATATITTKTTRSHLTVDAPSIHGAVGPRSHRQRPVGSSEHCVVRVEEMAVALEGWPASFNPHCECIPLVTPTARDVAQQSWGKPTRAYAWLTRDLSPSHRPVKHSSLARGQHPRLPIEHERGKRFALLSAHVERGSRREYEEH